MPPSTLLTVATGSLIAGGAIGYVLGSSRIVNKLLQKTTTAPETTTTTETHQKSEEPEVLIQKAYQNIEKVVGKTIDDYVLEHSLREPGPLEQLRKVTIESLPNYVYLCDQVEGQLIRLLLNIINAERCIEVGAYTGYNTLNMALCLPAHGKVVACDITDEYLNVGKPFFEQAGVANKIECHIRPAVETLDELIQKGEGGSYDCVFIDADKPGYDVYYERGMVLLRRGGLAIFDNTLYQGLVIGGDEKISKIKDNETRANVSAIHKLNKKLKHDERIQMSFLKIADGVTIARKL